MRARRVARAAVLMGVGAAAATHHHNKKMHQQEKREHLWLTALSSTLSARARHHHAPVVFVVCWKKKEIVHAQLNISKTDLIFDQELAHTKKYAFHIVYVRNSPPKGVYKVAVDFKGQCFHDCKKSKPIVSVWDFRRQEMGLFHVTQDRPTVRTADFRALQSIDNHLPVNNWIVGSFVVDGSLFGWHARFNALTTGYPTDWTQTPQNIASLLDDDDFDDSDSDDDDDCKMVISEYVQPQIVVVQNPPPVNPQSVPQPYYPPPQVPLAQPPQPYQQPTQSYAPQLYPPQQYPLQQYVPQPTQSYPQQPQQYQAPPQQYAPQYYQNQPQGNPYQQPYTQQPQQYQAPSQQYPSQQPPSQQYQPYPPQGQAYPTQTQPYPSAPPTTQPRH